MYIFLFATGIGLVGYSVYGLYHSFTGKLKEVPKDQTKTKEKEISKASAEELPRFVSKTSIEDQSTVLDAEEEEEDEDEDDEEEDTEDDEEQIPFK